MSTLKAHDQQVSVLHIGKYFPPDPGGMETYLHDLMISSLQQGTRSIALVHRSQLGVTSTHERYQASGFELSVTRAATWLRLLFTPISPAFPWLIRRLIKQHRPSLLHLHLPNPSAFWALTIPSARRLPWVIHWQSDVMTPKSGALLKALYHLYRPLESRLLQRARRIIVTSTDYLESSETLAPFKSKCRVIPLGITDRFQSPDSRDPDKQTDRPLKVLAIGRLAHYKGFDVLIDAIAHTSQIELDVVGGGEQLEALQARAHALGIASRVRFHGNVGNDEKDALLLACDCLCLPSTDRTESFGIVLLEAMSAGKACVVSQIPGSGVNWVVDSGQTGVMVEGDSPAALANAFERLSDDRAQLSSMGARGRERFERLLTIEASAQAVIELYDEISATNTEAAN